MADGRQKAEWARGASLTAASLSRPALVAGPPVDPRVLIPGRYRPPAGTEAEPDRPADPAAEARESELAWRLLDQGLRRVGR